jgi:catechol 2,3-dioxygenase-like lactoylglutathione lyase family enzyme
LETMIVGLDVGVVTTNMVAMTAFYRDVLGAPLVGQVTLPGMGQLTKLQCGQSQIKMLEPVAAAAPGAGGEGFAAVTGLRYLTLTVEDIAASLERCRRAGARVAVDLTTVRPGVTAAMVEDPDGNAVELMQIR